MEIFSPSKEVSEICLLDAKCREDGRTRHVHLGSSKKIDEKAAFAEGQEGDELLTDESGQISLS